MSRPATGQLTVTTLVDGTRAFQLRFRAKGRRETLVLHERRGCTCGCGGGWTKRTAAVELDNVLARVKAGVWTKRQPVQPAKPARMPTFHEYASAWLKGKTEGSIGDRPIDVNTVADYRWRLTRHLLPFFARFPLDEIDAGLCQDFKAAKLREAAEIRKAIEAGAILRDDRGRRVRPLGSASIKMLINCLATILDEAIEDGHIDRNPARGGRMRVRVPKPPRSFLEMDELVALTDAAGAQDAELIQALPPRKPGTTAAKVADRRARDHLHGAE